MKLVPYLLIKYNVIHKYMICGDVFGSFTEVFRHGTNISITLNFPKSSLSLRFPV